MQAFSCLATLPAFALVIVCPATNPWSLSPTRGDTPVKSTHACFSQHTLCYDVGFRYTVTFELAAWGYVVDILTRVLGSFNNSKL
ncbi:hypothetical protein HanRHA438_Chr08g0355301 [Helianthus annuus]|nr:hypothetical protein HanRHA438_Chr08g0355301 [Helianthus annuus]